jgi:hypothetical protein
MAHRWRRAGSGWFAERKPAAAKKRDDQLASAAL